MQKLEVRILTLNNKIKLLKNGIFLHSDVQWHQLLQTAWNIVINLSQSCGSSALFLSRSNAHHLIMRHVFCKISIFREYAMCVKGGMKAFFYFCYNCKVIFQRVALSKVIFYRLMPYVHPIALYYVLALKRLNSTSHFNFLIIYYFSNGRKVSLGKRK